MTEKLNIALLAGGNSSEREISLKSASQVAKSLNKEKYNVILIDIYGLDWHHVDHKGNKWSVDKNDFTITIEGARIALQYALILIHGTPGEDGRLQAYLDLMNIPYSSCGMVSSVITFEKNVCKRVVERAGVPTAKEMLIQRGDSIDTKAMVEFLGLPMFIKPNASGSSFGVSKVLSESDILPAIESALKEGDCVLAEEYVEGREMGCGILITENEKILFPITEIVSKKDFFDYEAKYTPGFSDEITPADIPVEIANLLNDMTLKACKACNCRGIVRVDFIVKPSGDIVMIEINTIPGMSEGSIVPKQVAYMGKTLGELFELVIEQSKI